MEERKKLIVGNWKMYGNRKSVAYLLQELKLNFTDSDLVDVIICPPYVFLSETQEVLRYTNMHWGAQNVSDKEQGAFTGEISATMLLDYGCNYVIIGHSERRTLYNEDNYMIAQKFVYALKSGLSPILCVGESSAERLEGKTIAIVSQQLAAVLELVDNLDLLDRAIIAYEPIWAIGTGQVATPDQAQEIHLAIRHQLSNYNTQLAKKMRIIYGGSVNTQNAASLFSQPDIDGALVGGASLNSQQFLEIIKLCHKSF